MNKSILKIVLLAVVTMFGAACSSNFEEFNKGNDVLSLTTSIESLTLNEINHNSDGLTLTWTTGTNYNTGNRINYILQFAKSGTNFASPVDVNMGSGVNSWSKKIGDLNTFLTQSVGMEYGETATIDVRVIANVAEYPDDTQIATTSFSVTTYKPVSTTLYMIGDATPTGWNAGSPTEMLYTDNGLFTWTGKLTKSGKCKFITTKGQFLPSYNRDAGNSSEWKLIYRNNDNDPDEQFSVSQDGIYTVTADILNMEVTVTESSIFSQRFDDVYFVGSFTNWNFIRMTPDALRLNLWHYGDVFTWNNGGEFKFGTLQGWDNMLFASKSDAPYTNTGVVYKSTSDDKWLLKEDECDKAYKIMLDVTNGSEKMLMLPFTPYACLYLVGDATPSGWDINNATAMTATESPYIFTWTGKLTAGGMKITCDKKSDWSGAWFMADSSDKVPTGSIEYAIFVDKSNDTFKSMYTDVAINDVDRKWKISEAGVYAITINQLKETISIVKK